MKLNSSELRSLRKKRRWTLERVGKMVGVHRQSIFHYEKGLTDPSLEIFVKICEVYGVAPQQLLNFSNLDQVDIEKFKTKCERDGLSTQEAIKQFIKAYGQGKRRAVIS